MNKGQNKLIIACALEIAGALAIAVAAIGSYFKNKK